MERQPLGRHACGQRGVHADQLRPFVGLAMSKLQRRIILGRTEIRGGRHVLDGAVHAVVAAADLHHTAGCRLCLCAWHIQQHHVAGGDLERVGGRAHEQADLWRRPRRPGDRRQQYPARCGQFSRHRARTVPKGSSTPARTTQSAPPHSPPSHFAAKTTRPWCSRPGGSGFSTAASTLADPGDDW